jgi:CheY-like chemotaxis protein
MAEPARVLVVEDDAIIREVLMLALEDEGYEARSAIHGHRALEELRAWPADLVILDLMLPVMDGWTFLRERQRQALCPDAAVIVLTAARQPLAPALREAGATLAMAKPFELDELLAAIARVLEPVKSQPE